MQIYTSYVWFNYLYFGGWKQFFESKLVTEKISCFEMTNSRALDTLTIYSNTSKIRLLIQITLCRNARIQMDISKKNRSSAEKAMNYFLSHWEKKKGTNMWNAWVLWVFLHSHASKFLMGTEDNSKQRHFTIPSSSKLELLCQCEMTSWYYIVTKSFYLLWERLKFNQVNINIFKVKKKSNTTTCEICPKVTIQAPKRR